MKHFSKLILLAMLLAFGIVLYVSASEGEYISQITSEECFLCGDHSKTNHSAYWGQDNVGLVHLNTFDVLPLRINRYSDSGELIRKEFGSMESKGLYRDNTYANSMVHPDRGYASIEITKIKYEVERTSVQTHLCEVCIQPLNSFHWSDDMAPEFAIVNFKEKTIRPLDRSLSWFFIGNYGIHCEYEENGDIDLLIAFLPPRWE